MAKSTHRNLLKLFLCNRSKGLFRSCTKSGNCSPYTRRAAKDKNGTSVGGADTDCRLGVPGSAFYSLCIPSDRKRYGTIILSLHLCRKSSAMMFWLLWISIGLAIGTMGTLIGAGGGFLLVPLMLLALPGMSPDQVTAVSIAVVAANALSGTLAYVRSGRVDYKAGLLFALATIPGSILGVYLTHYIPITWFRFAFALLLLLLSGYLFVRNRRGREDAVLQEPVSGRFLRIALLRDRSGKEYRYQYNSLLGVLISILVGFISPLLGIGGGIIHVPAMVNWLYFPVHIATATSHFVLAIMSSVSVLVHLSDGHYADPAIRKLISALVIGVLPGAQMGARLSHRVSTTAIVRALALCLALVGLRILWTAIAVLF